MHSRLSIRPAGAADAVWIDDFLRYRWPWFAVVDEPGHFLGVVRADRVGAEIQSGRPALPVREVLDDDVQALRRLVLADRWKKVTRLRV